MAKKTTKKDNFRTMTWKEAYSFCAAHVLVEKKRPTRPMLHHVAIRLAAGNPSRVILAATSGQTAAFLEMGIGWLASVLPALPAQLEERWQYVDKDGALFTSPHGVDFPSAIRNVIPQDLEHRPGYGPHLGYGVFEPIFRSMKAAGFVDGVWYMAPPRHRADGKPGEYGKGPSLFRIESERLSMFSACILAMPTWCGTPMKAGRILEGL